MMAHKSSSLIRASVLPLFAVLLVPHTNALELDTTSTASISSTAQSIASSLISTYYNADATTGDFNQPQSWCMYPLPSSLFQLKPSFFTSTNDLREGGLAP